MAVFMLDSGTVLLLAPEEPYGVRYAAKAVRRDIREASGAGLRLAEEWPDDATSLILIESTGELAREYGFAADIAADEQFAIRPVERNGIPCLLISGNGERGAIFGAYHFSEAHLGTDPFKYITGYRPSLTLPLKLDNADHTSAPAAFRLRGWHIETCGLWNMWATTEQNRFRHWQRVFETLLRCGGNMVKPNTNRPESQPVSIAQKMGLLITQEHAEPLGAGTWEVRSDDPEFNHLFDDFPEAFIEAWDDAIARYPDRSKVIWTLNYRGVGDQPFYVDHDMEVMPRYDTDAKRGAGITRALKSQRELVEKRCAGMRPEFIHNLWMEGNRLMAGGHVELPGEDVVTVWSDNMYGSFRSAITFGGLTPDKVVEALPDASAGGRHGTYYHVAGGDYCAPFLNAYVPPERIEEEYAKVWARGMTDYLLVNVQYVAPQIMQVAAFHDLWNHPDRWFGESAEGAAGFVRRWCGARFGGAADDAARCYAMYFDALTRYADQIGYDDYIIGGEGYARAAESFVRGALSAEFRRLYEKGPDKFYWGLPAPMPLAEQMDRLYGKMLEAEPKWEEAIDFAHSVAERLEGTARTFFETDVIRQMEIFQAFTRYLRHIIDAVRAYERMDWDASRTEASAAMCRIDEVHAACERRVWGEWDDFWDKERYYRIACLPKAWDMARLLRDAARGVQGNQSVHWMKLIHPATAGWRDNQSGPVAKFPHHTPPEDLYGD